MTIARLTWTHPETNAPMSYDLSEGSRVTIGRAAANEISIPHVTVSRQHATIEYVDGMFMLSDLGSSNGTFLNDEMLTSPFPLMSGDRIRLFGPEVLFMALMSDEEHSTQQQPVTNLLTNDAGTVVSSSMPYLLFLTGPQKDIHVPLGMHDIRIGRATQNHTWEIGIQDASVSRPHTRIHKVDDAWIVYDLGSSNGTLVNNVRVTEKGKILVDGDVITIGSTMMQFRI
jgi:pSer/pThr/pTyr-binding forkhead associated (FHA) protein